MFTIARLLEKHEYEEFLLESLHPSNNSISDYLFSLYKLHHEINHKFTEIIFEEIQSIINTADKEIKKRYKVSKITKKHQEIRFAAISKEKILIDIPPDQIPFYNQKMTSITQLNEEYARFVMLVEKFENKGSSSIKIDWDEKSLNHLYYLLKQLKSIGLIKNSIPELANFVKENFPAFSNKSTTSIRDAIQKGVVPKRGSIETERIIKNLKD